MRITVHFFTVIVLTLTLSCIATHTNKDGSKSTKILFKALNSIFGTGEDERVHQHQQQPGYNNPAVGFANPYPYQQPYPYAPSSNGYTHGEYHNAPPDHGGFGTSIGANAGHYHNGPVPPFGGPQGIPLPTNDGDGLAGVHHNGPDRVFSAGNAYGPVPNALTPTGAGADDGAACPETGCTHAARLPQYPGAPAEIDETAVSGAGLLDVRSGYPKKHTDEVNNTPSLRHGYAAGDVNVDTHYNQQPPYPRPPVTGSGANAQLYPVRPVHSTSQYPNVDDHEHIYPSQDPHAHVPRPQGHAYGHSTEYHHNHHPYQTEYRGNGYADGNFQGHPNAYGYGGGAGSGYNRLGY